MLELLRPDLMLTDTRLPGMDGFALVEELRKNPEWTEIPIIFLSSDVSVESKVQGLERGVEDYLTKPIYIKEIIARVNLVLQRKQRAGLEQRGAAGKTRFTGSLADMGLVDLLQTVDNSKKSGVLYVNSSNQRGAIYFREGNVVDAELGPLHGERAIYRALVWSEGTFELDFREVRREDVIRTSTQGVLMEGMRRLDEWGRLLEQLPDLDGVFEVNDEELLQRLAELPDEVNSVLKHFDGNRSVLQIVDRCEQDDLETLTVISKLFFEGLIFDTGRKAGADDPAVISSKPPRLTDRAGANLMTLPGAEGSEYDDAPMSSMVPASIEPDPDEHRPSRTAPGMPRPRLNALGVISNPPDSVPVGSRITHDFGRRDRPNNRRSRRMRRASGGSWPWVRPPAPETDPEHILRAPEPQGYDGPTERPPDRGADTVEESPRARRKRRRRKRLSIVTSPGLLTAADFAPRTRLQAAQASSEADPELMGSEALVTDPPPPLPPAPPAPLARQSEDTLQVPRTSRTSSAFGSSARPPSVNKTWPPPASIAPAPEEPISRLFEAPVPRSSVPQVPVSAAQSAPPAVPASARPPERPRSVQPQIAAEPSSGASTTWRPNVRARAPEPEQDENREDLHSTLPPKADARVLTVPRNTPLVRVALAAAMLMLLIAVVYRLFAPSAPTRTHAGTPVPARPPTTLSTPTQLAPAPQSAPAAQNPSAATAVAAPAAVEPVPAAMPEAAALPTANEAPAADDPQGRVHALMEQARTLELAGKPRKAMELYEQAEAIDPNAADVLSRLAFNYLNRGENQKASDYAARAVAVSPASSEGWIVLGAAKHALGDPRAARDAYRKCVELGQGPYVDECRRVAH